MKYLILGILILFSSSAIAQNASIRKVVVEPYKTFQNYEHFKRLVLNSDLPEMEYLEGFEFDWGYRYELSVAITKLKSTLSDGTRFNYELLSIESKEFVPETYEFQMFLESDLYYHDGGSDEQVNNFKSIGEDTYLYFEEVEIVVPPEFQKEFEKLLDGSISKRGQFKFLDKNRIEIQSLK